MEQPQGFEIHGRESHVYRLKKSVYGMKQAPRAWYSRIDSCCQWVFRRVRLIRISISSWLEIICSLFCCIWMIFFITGEERPIVVYKRDISSEYEMNEIGLMHYFLGSKVW